MRWILDLVFIAIVAVGVWRGYRNGIIRGICGILAVIVSLYGANIIANIYSSEFSGMIEPFAEGIVDAAVNRVLSDDNEEEPVVIVLEKDKTDVYTVCFAALREVGLAEKAAHLLAAEVEGETNTVNQDMTGTLATKLCDKLASTAVIGVAFILLAIIFSVIGNLVNLSFTIPGLGIVEPVAGAVLGLIKGLIIMYTLAMFVRYMGLILSEETIESTKILSGIINSNPVANALGL